MSPPATYDPTSEFPRLLLAARRGSRVAQGTLFRRYLPQVERIAHAQLRRQHAGRGTDLAARFSTADIVQEVFYNLLRRLAAFDGTSEGEFISYVKSIVRSRVIDSVRFHQASPRDLRRHVSALESFAPELLDALPAPSTAMNDPETASDLEAQYRAILASFPAREREVLHARIELGLCFTELAEQLGYPSRYAARRAFFAAQSRLSLRLKAVLPTRARAN